MPSFESYCFHCSVDILSAWKGWPHKDTLPILPVLRDGHCAHCSNSKALSGERITWFNYHSEFSTGLPDYWLLKIDGERTKWGHPYLRDSDCPRCGVPAIISEMNYPNGKHELKVNCGACGVISFRG